MPLLFDITASPGLPGEIWVSVIITAILLIFLVVVFIKTKLADPLKKPKGLMLLVELFVSYIDELVVSNMGRRFLKLSPYIGFLVVYLGSSFIFGLAGFPNPVTFYWIPFMFATVTVILIQGTAIYYKRFRYPLSFLNPLNIISAISPVLSLSLRLFANGLAGFILMFIVYGGLTALCDLIFSGLSFFIVPLVTPVFHLYFDVFSGFIQITVFVVLTMLMVNNEAPSLEEEVVRTATLRN